MGHDIRFTSTRKDRPELKRDRVQCIIRQVWDAPFGEHFLEPRPEHFPGQVPECEEDGVGKRVLHLVLTQGAVGQDGCSVAKTARDLGVAWACAMRCVRRHGEPLVDAPGRLDGVVAMGIDEHKMLCANGEHHTEYVTCFVDVRRGRLLDVVRDHKDDPLYSTRRLMTRGWERLSDRQRVKLLDALRSGDPDGEVGVAILAKELLRDMYAARSLTSARWKLVAFYQCAAEAEVPELTRLAKTIASWETEFLNYHVTGISNGPTEAQNLIAEKLRRIGHGMRNFENYRLRLLLHSGVQWNAQSTARIRGRHPRLIA